MDRHSVLADVFLPFDLLLVPLVVGYALGMALRYYRLRAWRQGFDVGARAARVLERVRAEEPAEATP